MKEKPRPRDIFDVAEVAADTYPQARWVEVRIGERWWGFAIFRGVGLELRVEIYTTAL